MSDPHILAGAVTGAGMGLTTIVLGAQVDALVIGLAAAFFASIWMEAIDSRSKAASAVLLSSMLAGYGSPVLAGYLASKLPEVASSGDSLRLLVALVIGAAAPHLIPLAIRKAAGKIDGGAL